MPTLNWIGKESVIRHHREVPFRLLETVAELSLTAPSGGEGGDGGFQFCRLSAEPLFDADGQIRTGVGFAQLAECVWFAESGTGFSPIENRAEVRRSPSGVEANAVWPPIGAGRSRASPPRMCLEPSDAI